MQTRKRAKSVTFGKKHKEKEATKKAAEEEVVKADASEKEVKEESAEKSTEKTSDLSSELSDTLPKVEPESASSPVETPASEFISENPVVTTPDTTKEAIEEKAVEPAEPAAAPTATSTAAPIETPAQPSVTPEQPQGSPESSSVLPQSAFTIQSNEQAPQQATAPVAETGTGKKQVGLYFFVVALIAFILGLGAMAAASYFGLINSKLSSQVTFPLIGQKPTPTVPPPVATATPKPVDLTLFTISVLNGSGIAGKAAQEKTALTTAGFKVTSTDNAANNNFTKTEIGAKKAVTTEFLKKLEGELGKSFNVDTTVSSLTDSSTTDIIVTIGSDTAK